MINYITPIGTCLPLASSSSLPDALVLLVGIQRLGGKYSNSKSLVVNSL